MKIKYVSSLLFALAFAAAVQAQQVVSYYAEIPNVTSGTPQVIELPGFDTALGNLTAVKLTYTGEIWQSVFGENMNSTSSTYDFSNTAQLSLAKDNGLTLFAPPAFTLKRKGVAGVYDGSVDFANASGFRFNQNVANSGVYVDPELAQYAGVQAINFKASTMSFSSLDAVGNFAKGSSLSALASLSVDYTFTPLTAIPEPGTYAFLVGGVMMMAVAYKRRLFVAA